MRVLVLGAGLIGTTLAYELMQRGHEVVVIDRQLGAARECSFANGGQLSYSHAEPWATPRLLPKIIQWFGKKDAPLVFRLHADPAMWRWALQFLARCTTARNLEGTRTMLRLSLYSRECFRKIVAGIPLDFAFRPSGTLHVYQDKKVLAQAIRHAEFQQELGCGFTRFSPEETVQKEPALMPVLPTLAGGLFFPLDDIGDAYTFTTGLAAQCKGVEFRWNTSVTRIETDGEKVTGVTTDKGTFTADAYVMALGADSPLLLNPIGVRIPIYPLKGYSATLQARAQPFTLQTSILHEQKKVVVTPLGSQLRIAGTAEFTGYDTQPTSYRVDAIIKAAQDLFPGLEGIQQATSWACLRPAIPDGAPVLGHSPFKNLFLNTGHGSLGWTLCAGSAVVVADIMEGKTPAIALEGLTGERFLRK